MVGMTAVTKITMETYDREAVSYAKLTGSYDGYPGLDLEVDAFEALAPPGPLLDAGCGAGRDAVRLSTHGRLVLAVDVSAELVRLARAKTGSGSAGPSYARADITSLPVAQSCFAGIWMCASLVHVPTNRHPAVLRDSLRALMPGGVLAVSMKAGDRDELAAQGSAQGLRWLSEVQAPEMKELMATVGFMGVRTEASGRGQWYIATGFRR